MKTNTPENLPAPAIRSDGSCTACSGGWQCKYHQLQGVEDDRRKAEVVRKATESFRKNTLARIMAQFELESDEGGTAEEKAVRMLAKHGSSHF